MKAREGLELTPEGRDGAAWLFSIHVRPDHPAFPGHFPGRPVLPGMEIVGVVVRAASEVCGTSLCLRRVERARFIRPIAPEAELELSITVSARDPAAGGASQVGTAPVESASVGVAARLRDDLGLVARLVLDLRGGDS